MSCLICWELVKSKVHLADEQSMYHEDGAHAESNDAHSADEDEDYDHVDLAPGRSRARIERSHVISSENEGSQHTVAEAPKQQDASPQISEEVQPDFGLRFG